MREQRGLVGAVVAGLRTLMRTELGVVSRGDVSRGELPVLGTVTLEVVAQRMRHLGYAWRPDTLAQVDRGTRRLSPEELIGLLAVVVDVYDKDTAAGLIADDELVHLSPTWTISGGRTRWMFLVPLVQNLEAEGSPFPESEAVEMDELEERVATRLGWTPARVRYKAAALWGRRLVQERDARLAARHDLSDPASRERTAGHERAAGHVTRQLIRELAAAQERQEGEGNAGQEAR